MTDERYRAELAVLNRHLQRNLFVFEGLGTSSPRLKMGMMTNRRNVYTICIELNNFPEDVPCVYVTKMLRTKDGDEMDSPSASMHTLSSKNGWTAICHYGTSSWSPHVSLYKVYIRCRLWLEIYELHLDTGRPMDYYLKHQA